MLMLQGAIVIRFSNRPRNVASLLPQDGIDVIGTTVPADRFYLLAVILAATALLYLLFQRTKFGIRTRASAENEQFATLLGISADRIASINWIIAGILAGVVGILAAPITGLNPLNMTLFIIPAVAAGASGGDEVLGVLAVGGMCFFYVFLFVYSIALWLYLLAAMTNYAIKGTFGAFFEFREIWDRIRANPNYWMARRLLGPSSLSSSPVVPPVEPRSAE